MNNLQKIVSESGLEETKAQVILTRFQDYFQIASEWEARAKTIVVTDPSQREQMELARIGRLYLKEKRVAIEKTRKELKEQAIREGKAIDGLANVLKALIVPTEEYLERQEKYVEIKAREEQERLQAELDKKMEEERIVKEKTEAEERVRLNLENERLRKEAQIREQQMIEERLAANAKLKAERDKALEQSMKAEVEKKAREKAEAEKLFAFQREKDKEKKHLEELEMKEKEREARETEIRSQAKAELEKVKKAESLIICPKCGYMFANGSNH